MDKLKDMKLDQKYGFPLMFSDFPYNDLYAFGAHAQTDKWRKDTQIKWY